MHASLEIRCFGQLSITQNGSPISGLASRKAEALLVYLACTGQAHAREVLAELLWDERSQPQSMGNLRVVLCSLRQQLRPFVLITPRTVQFNCLSACWIDVLEVQRQLDSAEQEQSKLGILLPATTHQLAQTLADYQGDFLSGFSIRDGLGFEQWMTLERERLHHRVIEGFHQLITSYIYYQDYRAAITQAKRLLNFDPLDEVARQQLIMLLAQTGQRNAAMAQYDIHRHKLAEELGVQPLKETVSLYEKIRTGQLANMVSPAEPDSHQLTPFIGRACELAEITGKLNMPSCRLLTLVGPAGIGKTRLALKIAEYQALHFEHGCFFISFSSTNDGPYLTSKIAESLRFSFKNWGHPKQQLFDYLADKHMLLILDGFEYVLSEVEFISDLLSRAPKTKVLVTSRQCLNVHDEWAISIEGLARPQEQTSAEPIVFEAVELFVQRASRTQPGFSLTMKNRSDVIRICQLLKGIPSAIELAADQLSTTPCSQIAGYIQSNPECFLKPQQTSHNTRLSNVREIESRQGMARSRLLQ